MDDEGVLRSPRVLMHVAPFAIAAIAALIVGALPPNHMAVGQLLAAGAVCALVILTCLLLPWRRLPRWSQACPPLVFFLVVALLRDAAGGSASGLIAMALLPVMWMALYSTPVEMVFALLGVIGVFAVPLLFIGGERYPEQEWNQGLIWTICASMVAVTVHRLVMTERRLRAAAIEGTAELERARRARDAGFAGSPIGMATFTLDGRLVEVNDALLTMLGCPAERVLGTRIDALLADGGRTRLPETAETRTARASDADENRIPRPDGTSVWVKTALTVVRDEGDRPLHMLGQYVDITDRRLAQDSERAHAEDLEAVAHAIRELPDGDTRGGLVRAARRLARADVACILEPRAGGLRVTAGTEPHVAGQSRLLTALTGTAEGPHAAAAMRTARRVTVPASATRATLDTPDLGGAGTSLLFEPLVRHGETVGVLAIGWDEDHARPDMGHLGAIALLAAEAAVVIERSDLLDHVRKLSRTDALTGLPNRRVLHETLDLECARARRGGGRALCVAMVDLDHFKEFNDARGHQAGDRMLKAAAGAWRANLRETDLLARYGGEEFVVVLPDCSIADAVSAMERMRELTPMGQTCSIGVARWESETVDGLLSRADSALYAAKTAGRDRVAISV